MATKVAKKVTKKAKAKATGDKNVLVRKSEDRPAIHYYKAPNGKIVKEITNVPEPKKLSKFGKWMRDNPNGLEGEILDMRAVLK
jgi:hypothetical protein